MSSLLVSLDLSAAFDTITHYITMLPCLDGEIKLYDISLSNNK